jgi:hypothetical protein
LDEVLADAHDVECPPIDELTIDMSAVRFMHVDCVTPLIAEFAARHKLKLATRLRLPRSLEVRQALRTWDFARAIRLVTGMKFIDIVDPRDHQYFQGLGGDLRGRVYGLETYSIKGAIVSLPPLTRRFMPIRHWAVRDVFSGDATGFQRAVLDETSRWREDPVVRASLRYHLGAYYGYVWTHIVHEAMSNAFRHGAAKSIIATSKADPDPSGRDVHLTLTFWDDGLPMHETLRAGVKNEHGILGSAFGKSETLQYRVRVRDRNDLRFKRDFIASSDIAPSSEAPAEEFLLATVYPGLTADPFGRFHVPHPEMGNAGELPTLPGMGLANLVNGAVDVLKGSVVFRSGEYFMNVKASSRSRQPSTLSAKAVKTNYAVKIERRWPICGNILTVRLPLRNVPKGPPSAGDGN